MPTYEYECAKCKKGFEIFQSMKDDALTVCPKEKCRMKTWGKGKVKRKLGVGAGFIFKGSGFYITDYRSEGYKSGAKSESDSAKPASSDSSKSDAKPKTEAAKPAAKTESSPKPAAKKE
jgi:putative FmdB family regulatory protein